MVVEIENLRDFTTVVYVIVDDIWQQIKHHFVRPGPEPACSDSELLTMALVGECRGWERETELLSQWAEYRDLFPVQPERSRFNRRRRQLQEALGLVRRIVLEWFDVAQDRQAVIDSLPLPVVKFHLVPGASRDWAYAGASFGRVSSKKQQFYGYKLHLLVTLSGVVLDFILAPAHESDVAVGADLLSDHTDLVVLGDKGYVSKPLAQRLLAENRLQLLALPRRNQRTQLPPPLQPLVKRFRQRIESVNNQLADQFHIERTDAHSFDGLAARLLTKLAAHTLSLFINFLAQAPNFHAIKALAFPAP